MRPCRTCEHEVSEEAVTCPNCGAPNPANPNWDGWGYEYKSKLTIANMPLLHIAFKYRPNRMPVVARGIIAIGQFGAGVITVAQFGVGIVNVSQMAVGVWAIGQFAVASSLIAQVGIYFHHGRGQAVISFMDAVHWLLGNG